jgi:hypothetical protein
MGLTVSFLSKSKLVEMMKIPLSFNCLFVVGFNPLSFLFNSFIADNSSLNLECLKYLVKLTFVVFPSINHVNIIRNKYILLICLHLTELRFIELANRLCGTSSIIIMNLLFLSLLLCLLLFLLHYLLLLNLL